MNQYEKLKAAMKAELKEKACTACNGRGQFNDAEPGDISCKEWDCPDCRGTGLKAQELINPNHQKDHCDYCKIAFMLGDESIAMRSGTKFITVCPNCYATRGKR